MRLVKDVIRGNYVVFEADFRDETNTVVTPVSAIIYLTYLAANTSNASTNSAMSYASNVWSYTWDSGLAGEGMVDWYIKGTTDSGSNIATQGTFRVTVNRANP